MGVVEFSRGESYGKGALLPPPQGKAMGGGGRTALFKAHPAAEAMRTRLYEYAMTLRPPRDVAAERIEIVREPGVGHALEVGGADAGRVDIDLALRHGAEGAAPGDGAFQGHRLGRFRHRARDPEMHGIEGDGALGGDDDLDPAHLDRSTGAEIRLLPVHPGGVALVADRPGEADAAFDGDRRPMQRHGLAADLALEAAADAEPAGLRRCTRLPDHGGRAPGLALEEGWQEVACTAGRGRARLCRYGAACRSR